MIHSNILTQLSTRLPTLLDTAVNPSFWALDYLGTDLYDNQIDIVDAVTDLNEKYVAILQSRGSGKTFSVGVGLVKLCLDIPGFSIGIFGPKTEQATRIISEIKNKLLVPTSKLYPSVDWNDSTNSRLKFRNGSIMLAISASEKCQNEGWHFNCVTGSTVILTDKGALSIQQIVESDVDYLILSYNEKQGIVEYKPLEVKQTFTAKKPLLQLTTSSGSTITCTEDHKILTDRGWIEARNLQVDDTVYEVIP